jgi:fluoride exporter
MKGLVIEMMLIAIGAVAGAFLRYRITYSLSLLLDDAVPINVLLVNIIGSFILGVFTVLAIAWNLDSKTLTCSNRVLGFPYDDVFFCT